MILGLTDGAFPPGRPAPGYDLMARAPRAGDRSQRSDDRHLFLEALLSARDRLILTAPARDVRDGSDLPLSIVVTELLEALDQEDRDMTSMEVMTTGGAPVAPELVRQVRERLGCSL